MPAWVSSYVKHVDKICYRFGRLAMYLMFAMIATLLLSAITRNVIFYPLSWCIEMAQFILAAYYIVGGAYSMQLDDHVRMDLVYSRFSDKNQARIDVVTSFFLMFYLVALLIGSISSTLYAIEYDQRKFSQWNPSMIPIKIIMVFGIVLMILQTVSIFFKDLSKATGRELS